MDLFESDFPNAVKLMRIKEMYRQTESYFRGFLDARLYFQRWVPEGVSTSAQKGHLVITHGQGEHSESYKTVVDSLAGSGWMISAWDWRGHGRSDGLRGYARHFNDYCNDFEVFLETQVFRLKGPYPLVLLSHSMGGLIQLKTLANHSDWPVRAQILSNPLLGVAVHVPEIKQKAARLSLELLPKVTLFNEIRDEDLTTDPDMIVQYSRDSLRHNRISSGAYLGSLEAIEWVKKAAGLIQIETLLQISTDDPIVSSAANREYFQSLSGPKKILEYGGFKHELYNEKGREKPLKDLKNYLKSLHKL